MPSAGKGDRGKEERKGWDVKSWAEENRLAPIGANFFYSKNKKQ